MADDTETTGAAREARHATGDQGCLRWVMGVPLVILNVLAAYCCYGALVVRPSYPGDEGALLGIELACMLTIGISVVALLVAAGRSVRRAMGLWWCVPPALMTVVAGARWILLD